MARFNLSMVGLVRCVTQNSSPRVRRVEIHKADTTLWAARNRGLSRSLTGRMRDQRCNADRKLVVGPLRKSICMHGVSLPRFREIDLIRLRCDAR